MELVNRISTEVKIIANQERPSIPCGSCLKIVNAVRGQPINAKDNNTKANLRLLF